MTIRSPRVMLGAAVLAVTLIAMLVTLRADPPQTFLLRTSSTFDVTNLRHLAGYADNIFVANVQEIQNIKDEHTQYRVAVEETVKGALEGEIVVSQLGYKADNQTHVTEAQSLLVPGNSYLLVTNPDTSGSGWQTLVTGSTSAVLVNEDNRNSVIEKYSDATARQVYPPGLPPKEQPEE